MHETVWRLLTKLTQQGSLSFLSRLKLSHEVRISTTRILVLLVRTNLGVHFDFDVFGSFKTLHVVVNIIFSQVCQSGRVDLLKAHDSTITSNIEHLGRRIRK
jgi:hypothetical protein